MKKIIPALAVIAGAAALVAYKLKKDEETVILHSLNPDAEDVDVPPLSELRTLGRVLGGYDPYTRDIIW